MTEIIPLNETITTNDTVTYDAGPGKAYNPVTITVNVPPPKILIDAVAAPSSSPISLSTFRTMSTTDPLTIPPYNTLVSISNTRNSLYTVSIQPNPTSSNILSEYSFTSGTVYGFVPTQAATNVQINLLSSNLRVFDVDIEYGSSVLTDETSVSNNFFTFSKLPTNDPDAF